MGVVKKRLPLLQIVGAGFFMLFMTPRERQNEIHWKPHFLRDIQRHRIRTHHTRIRQAWQRKKRAITTFWVWRRQQPHKRSRRVLSQTIIYPISRSTNWFRQDITRWPFSGIQTNIKVTRWRQKRGWHFFSFQRLTFSQFKDISEAYQVIHPLSPSSIHPILIIFRFYLIPSWGRDTTNTERQVHDLNKALSTPQKSLAWSLVAPSSSPSLENFLYTRYTSPILRIEISLGKRTEISTRSWSTL